MFRFRPCETSYKSSELAVFDRAYENACRELGIEPRPPNSDGNDRKRDELAAAVTSAAQFGERDPIVLSAYAVVVAVRRWRLTDPQLT